MHNILSIGTASVFEMPCFTHKRSHTHQTPITRHIYYCLVASIYSILLPYSVPQYACPSFCLVMSTWSQSCTWSCCYKKRVNFVFCEYNYVQCTLRWSSLAHKSPWVLCEKILPTEMLQPFCIQAVSLWIGCKISCLAHLLSYLLK